MLLRDYGRHATSQFIICCPFWPKRFPETRKIQNYNYLTLFQWFSAVGEMDKFRVKL